MSNPVNGSSSGLDALSSSRLTQSTTKSKTLGQDDFLKLMITQMKNQDPMKPMDGGEFVSQMAQFGTVSGIGDLQKSFATLASSLQSSQALQASTMVGRQVLVGSDKVQLNHGSAANFSVELTKSVGEVNVNLVDASGQVVRTLSLGSQGAGIHDVTWDGKGTQGNELPAGLYTVKVQTVTDGKTEAGTSLVRVPVESVSLGRNGQQPTLNLAGSYGSVGMDTVREVF